MIDLRYHITSLVAVFLALGIGIIIGSLVEGGDVLVEQQGKMIAQLESQFTILRQRENDVNAENQFMGKMVKYYEEYSQTVSPPLIKDRLEGYQVAIVVTGGQAIPAGLVNSLALAGAHISSTSIFLPAVSMDNEKLKITLCDYYKVSHDTPVDDLRKLVSASVAGIVVHGGDETTRNLLQQNNLVKFNGGFGVPLHGIILIGGAGDETFNFPDSVDMPMIKVFAAANHKVMACETSRIKFSYMNTYQQGRIATIDDVDITPGQVALIRALEGETGDYGIKTTARKFMPSLPTEYLERGY